MWKQLLCLLVVIYPATVMTKTNELMTIAMGEVYKDRERAIEHGIDLEGDLRAIYSNAGIDSQFIFLPPERAIRSVIDGEYDALDMRLATLKTEDQLLRVNVPLASINYYFYASNGKFYNRLEDLKDEIVVAFHGSRHTNKIKHYKRIYFVHDLEQAALMLTKNRATVWFSSEPKYREAKKRFPQIKIASPIIYQSSLYHYIHFSKAHLFDKIEASAKAYVNDKKKKDL
ncbi:hypothetical protein GCM10007938_17120 [Vibrio zhanjiangensis]|uniref:Solute-binding protein family 3/N-terminal domain-containing protein n=1 Tax=Vibrio zhanjiangensis TaxID=1046128 RepID=A0ABQ6EY75_9VIBR|nr:transporter substrate-binding domain-containing protein [Vibrio zhanjiangensis]GLT17934.1 hypothetical protein GCM10007938_17120 [Vibrio zhanjiangensis]